MKTNLAILGFVLMAGGALTLFVGIIFSNFGICGPAPDAWILVVAGVLSFLAGLGLATPWLVYGKSAIEETEKIDKPY